jgi:hypothetical protein
MVKMMTTEPQVELKLKKGGSVSHPKKMMNGGVMSGLTAAAGSWLPAVVWRLRVVLQNPLWLHSSRCDDGSSDEGVVAGTPGDGCQKRTPSMPPRPRPTKA